MWTFRASFAIHPAGLVALGLVLGLVLGVIPSAAPAAGTSAADAGARIVTAPPPGARLAWRALVGRMGDQIIPAAAGRMVVVAVLPGAGDVSRGQLVGLDAATGRRRWRLDLDAAPLLPTVLGRSVFVGLADGIVIRADARSGAVRWRRATDLVPSRVLVGEGMVFVADPAADSRSGPAPPAGALRVDGQVIALNAATGVERWRFRPPGPPRRTRTHLGLGGGRVFVGTADGLGTGRTSGLWALDPATGRVLWHAKSGFVSSPSAVRGDLVYVAANAPRPGLQARSAASGRLRWVRPGSFFWPVAAGASVFAGPSSHHVEAIDPATGRLRWRTFVGERNLVPVARGGVVYVASLGRIVQARNAATGSLLWRVALPGADALALGRELVYVGSAEGALSALRLRP